MQTHSIHNAPSFPQNNRIRSVRQMIRAGVQLLAHDIEAGHPEVLAECLQAMARFPYLSFGNVVLIATQRPSSTRVCGWRGWQELGRSVKPGEKGIMIFAPILSAPRLAQDDAVPPEPQLLGFRPVRVWDAEQTYGPPIGTCSTINPDLADAFKKLLALAASQAIRIEYSDRIAPAKGTSFRGLIRLLPDLEAKGAVLVLARELAVQMLYESERRSFVMRDVLLREARAVAFVIAHALGLEPEPGVDLHLYQGDVQLLAESLAMVKHTSAVLLGTMSASEEQEGDN